MTLKIQINENDPKQPACPYCEKEIDSVSMKSIESVLGVRFLYYCSGCAKVLGISHRKGFWMG